MSQYTPYASPAPNFKSTQKRKRRPTRTPKPFSPQSRLCSPSPFLDRSSFKRKKILFNNGKISNSRPESTDADESTEYDDSSGSEYDIHQDLNEQYDQLDDDANHEEKETKSTDLVHDIENLSINSNKSLLSRNARCSIKTSKMQTPKLFPSKQSSKIKKPKDTKSKSQFAKQTIVRITKSNRVFTKHHTFGDILVAPLECGSGCPLYRSTWKQSQTVTKLMPCFENEEFTKEENVDNALREYELHADVYRRGCKYYGIDQSPVVSIYGCVTLKHRNKQYLTFVMPALHCNLAQFVTKYRKLTTEEALMFLRCGLQFLKILKGIQLIHNDIKPENVFVDVLFDEKDKPSVHKFVFGDFGCAALKNEEFPFGSLTGTVTMWDVEALGAKHGKEDGFSYENDLYGMLGCLLDGIYGGCILEELLEEEDEDWEDTEWNEYTDLVRLCRKKMNNRKFMKEELEHMKCENKILKIALMQIAEKRKSRMTLQQMCDLVL